MAITVLAIIIAVLVLGAGLFVLEAIPSVRTYFQLSRETNGHLSEEQKPQRSM